MISGPIRRPFVDHLQLLPVPFRHGRREPDGDHRPGGLGMATLSDLLAARGWTARVEDLSYDAPMPESRLAEAFARGIGDGVLSAWDRSRFPIVLTRAGYGALGVIDALGPSTGVVWVSADPDYRSRALFRRCPIDRTALAMVTGRAGRDKLAVRPLQIPAGQVIVLGGGRASHRELGAMAEDGVHLLRSDEIERLPERVEQVGATIGTPRWYLHIDLSALPAASVPAADDPRPEGIPAQALAAAIGSVFGAASVLMALTVARYDLNRDDGGRTAATLALLIEAAVLAAGGEPDPGTVQAAGGERSQIS